MDGMYRSSSDLSYSSQAPIIVAATSDAAKTRALRTIEAAGYRVGACVPIDGARERIAQQIASSSIWIELDADGGEPLDILLRGISNDVAAGRYAAVVSSTGALLDAVAAQVEDARVELIVDAEEQDRVAALALATAKSSTNGSRLSDVSSDQNAARLRQLNDEVSRIASMLARLSNGPGSELAPAAMSPPTTQAPEVSLEEVRTVIRARRLRTKYFADHLFADPAWDMLLDLFQAELAQLRVPVSSLCIAAAVPATTALRWLKTMVEEGLFLRRADPHDGRRIFVELAPAASDAMRRYFAELGKAAAI